MEQLLVRCHGDLATGIRRGLNVKRLTYVFDRHSFPSNQHVSVLPSSRHHLGADWRWSEDCKDEKYLKIVRLFEDRKAAVYSIHQVGPMLKYSHSLIHCLAKGT